MNGKSKYTITLVLSLLLGLALITGGCSSSDEKAPEKADQQKLQDNGETGGDGRPGQDDSKLSGDTSREDIGSQPITESQARLGDRGGQSGAEKGSSLPPADDRGTDMAPTDPPADDRGAGDADGRMDNRIVARVDMPPEVRDNLMNPKRRTDHQNPRALAWEQRDIRRDYRRPSNTLARVDTSADAPNRGFERESAATNDPGGGGSQDRMGNRMGSASEPNKDLAALTKGDDADSVKGGPAGEKTESAIAPPPPGEVVVVRRSWAKIRRAPRENSRAIALVYGNDTFQVVNTDGEWVQVRFGRNNRHKGWLSLSDVSK